MKTIQRLIERIRNREEDGYAFIATIMMIVLITLATATTTQATIAASSNNVGNNSYRTAKVLFSQAQSSILNSYGNMSSSQRPASASAAGWSAATTQGTWKVTEIAYKDANGNATTAANATEAELTIEATSNNHPRTVTEKIGVGL